MNHRKIGTDISHRRAILRNMTTSVLENGRVETTVPKAKEVRRQVEKMITLGKKGDLAAYRKAMAYLTDEDVVQKLFKEIAPGYEDRNGGYTRVLKSGFRRGDAAPLAIIELVQHTHGTLRCQAST